MGKRQAPARAAPHRDSRDSGKSKGKRSSAKSSRKGSGPPSSRPAMSSRPAEKESRPWTASQVSSRPVPRRAAAPAARSDYPPANRQQTHEAWPSSNGYTNGGQKRSWGATASAPPSQPDWKRPRTDGGKGYGKSASSKGYGKSGGGGYRW